jgi:aminoglycoside phosphotransferase family enzyme
LKGYRLGGEVNGEDSYFGVASIGNFIKDQALILGPLCTPRDEYDIKKALLDTPLEYALVMRRLPMSARLDELLSIQEAQSVETLLQQLVFHVKKMHDRAKVVDTVDEYGLRFGSPEQVINKLEHNIRWFEGSLVQNELRKKHSILLARLRRAWEWNKLPLLLEWRIKLNPKHIIEGHGDLHASNIFCLLKEGHVLERVVMLDLIDFYDDYFCMDRLSDIAMLIVDVEAQSGNVEWRELMMRIYLENEPNQAIARYLLRLYMLEKTVVRASVCLDAIGSLSTLAAEKKNQALIDKFLSLIDVYIEILRYERHVIDDRLEGLVQQ